MCATPHQPKVRFIRDTALIALADKHTLQFMNEGLVRKSKEGRQNKTKKHFGVARILTLEEALRKKEERKAKEQQEMDERERRAALRGLALQRWSGRSSTWGKMYLNEIPILRRELNPRECVERRV